MATENFVQVPPQSTGLKVHTVEQIVGVNTVEQEVVTIGDPAAANYAAVGATGQLSVAVNNSPAVTITSGTITANQGTAAAQASRWPVFLSDATNPVGTATNPIRNDPTGTTVQPVSGTITASQGTPPWTQRLQDGVGATLAAVTAGNALKVDGSAVTQPINGTVTGNQGTALSQTGAGWPVQPWGMADTLFASGSVTAPALGAVIATLTNPPAGTYRVNFYCGISTAAGVVGDANNMEFRKAAVVQLSALGGVAGGTGTATSVGWPEHSPLFLNLRMTLDGATSLSINATATGGASNTYVAQIMATRIF